MALGRAALPTRSRRRPGARASRPTSRCRRDRQGQDADSVRSGRFQDGQDRRGAHQERLSDDQQAAPVGTVDQRAGHGRGSGSGPTADDEDAEPHRVTVWRNRVQDIGDALGQRPEVEVTCRANHHGKSRRWRAPAIRPGPCPVAPPARPCSPPSSPLPGGNGQGRIPR